MALPEAIQGVRREAALDMAHPLEVQAREQALVFREQGLVFQERGLVFQEQVQAMVEVTRRVALMQAEANTAAIQ